MRLKKLFETDESESLKDMDLSDALYVLSEMVEDDRLSEKEIEIIEDMFDRLFSEESDEIEIDDTVAEMVESTIVDHGDEKHERSATFTSTPMSDRLQNRIKQRKYRRSAKYKALAKKKALIAKRCKGGNRSVQVSREGSGSYVCRLKDKFRSKLMKRVAQRYKN